MLSLKNTLNDAPKILTEMVTTLVSNMNNVIKNNNILEVKNSWAVTLGSLP